MSTTTTTSMNANAAQELEGFVRKIETAKQQMAQAQGSLATITESLEKEFGIKSTEEINAKLETLDAEMASIDSELGTLMQAIRTAFAEAGR